MPESVYKVIELVGSSPVSWEKAVATAVKQASNTLRDLRVAEVIQQDAHIAKDGSIESYRAKISNLIQVTGRGTGLIRSPAPGRARLAPARVCSRHGSAPVLWTGAKSLPVSVPAGLSDCVLEPSPSLSPWARRLDWHALLE